VVPNRILVVYDLYVSRRRLRRAKVAQTRANVTPAQVVEREPPLQEAKRTIRLAYTRSQAAEALGVSRSTFVRRVLPFVETVEMPWGAVLIPADELERLLAERRRPVRRRPEPSAAPGRPGSVSDATVVTIRHLRAEGLSFARIAARLNADGVPTTHGGRRWWPSTVRFVLSR
jgi:hypothetical protein